MKLLHCLVLCSIQGDGINKQAITKLATPFSSFATWASLLQGKPWGSDFMIQVISYFLGHFISRVQISLDFI
jgi:hypothetical protein